MDFLKVINLILITFRLCSGLIIKRRFFRATVESVLLYGATTWTLTKALESKLNGAYTWMLRAVTNSTWQDHPTNAEVYRDSSPVVDVIRERRTRFVEHSFRSKNELVSDLLLWAPEHGNRRRGRPHKNFIDQLMEDAGCTIEELPGKMNNRGNWKCILHRIRTSSTR